MTVAQEFSRGLALISNGHYHGSVPCEIVYRLHDVARVGEAAIAWNALRLEATRLRAERNAIPCELEVLPPDASFLHKRSWPTCSRPGDVPVCWKRDEATGDPEDPARRFPEEKWCASCVKRQALDDSYRACVRRRGAAERSVQRAAGAVR